MSIRIALIISAPLEMTLTAGREEISPEDAPLEDKEEEILPFLSVGHAKGDEIHLSGPLIGDPKHIDAGLSLSWYFPDEEAESQARVIKPSETNIIVTAAPRQVAEPGWRWRYRLESRKPCLETKFFGGGFQPPFRPKDLTLHVEHLVNYDYDGYILSDIVFCGRPASYIEAEWRFPQVEAEGYLDD